MKIIDNVLACVDFSDYTLETIEAALTIAKGQKTKSSSLMLSTVKMSILRRMQVNTCRKKFTPETT